MKKGTEVESGSMQVARAARISYRQLDYWIKQGYIDDAANAGRATGSGHYREIDDRETQVICDAAELVRLGVTPERAFALARKIADGDVPLTFGRFTLVITDAA